MRHVFNDQCNRNTCTTVSSQVISKVHMEKARPSLIKKDVVLTYSTWSRNQIINKRIVN